MDEIIPSELGSVLLVSVVPDIDQRGLCFPQDSPVCKVLTPGSSSYPEKPGREKMLKGILLIEKMCHLRKKTSFFSNFMSCFDRMGGEWKYAGN